NVWRRSYENAMDSSVRGCARRLDFGELRRPMLGRHLRRAGKDRCHAGSKSCQREFIKLQPIGFKLVAEGAFAACKDIGSDSKSLSLSNNERLSLKISVPQQKWAAPGVAAVIQCHWLQFGAAEAACP